MEAEVRSKKGKDFYYVHNVRNEKTKNWGGGGDHLYWCCKGNEDLNVGSLIIWRHSQ